MGEEEEEEAVTGLRLLLRSFHGSSVRDMPCAFIAPDVLPNLNHPLLMCFSSIIRLSELTQTLLDLPIPLLADDTQDSRARALSPCIPRLGLCTSSYLLHDLPALPLQASRTRPETICRRLNPFLARVSTPCHSLISSSDMEEKYAVVGSKVKQGRTFSSGDEV